MINSELQYIGVQIAEFVGEKTNVGLWIGVVKRIGKSRAFEILSTMKQNEDEYLHKPPLYRPKSIANKAAYFLSLTKKGRA
jgi:hypothetical protein